jgi:3-hydroxyacyl-[acyl-carrier-protein] dehydratase
MRFIFVDRILTMDPGRSIETLKNVSATEDVFADHFPGYPILPGALIVEAFEQAAQLLIGMSHDFATVGRLTRLSRVSFRRFVRPGDQLRLRCDVRSASPAWVVAARAEVEGRAVAAATLEYAMEEARADTPAGERAERLRVLMRELRQAPLDLAARGMQA